MNRVPKNNRGIALVLVLWVLALLAVLVGEFSKTMRTEINITRNFKEETQCYYLARAGIELALNSLLFKRPLPTDAQMGGAESEEEGFEWHLGSKIPPVSFGDGIIEIEIENESGKFNINSADSGLLKVMLNPFEMDEKDKNIIVDSILDWRDNDELHRLNGAESYYYQSLARPYKAKNGDFDAVEELLLVKGITPEIFYGGLREMVTLYTEKKAPDEMRSLSSGRINVNAAPPGVLLALPLMTEDLVLSVLDSRAEQPFKSATEVARIVGGDVYSAISPYISTEIVPQYTLRAVGTMQGIRTRRGVQAVITVDQKKKGEYSMLEWLDNIEIRPKTDGALR